MKQRIILIVLLIITFPFTILSLPLIILQAIAAIFIWIVTGDEDRAFDFIFGGIPGWLVELPYKISKYE